MTDTATDDPVRLAATLEADTLQRPIGTLTTRARWALIDGDRMRMVRAVEGRALMGFPDTYRLPANEATAWHLIGNAVAPTVAADVITALRAAA